MFTWNGKLKLSSKVLNDIQDSALNKANNKIGENYNHTSKNNGLFHLLNRALLEFSKSLAIMRELQESTIACDHRYKVSFAEQEETEPFQQLREKLAKMIKDSRKLDFRAVPLFKKADLSSEYDKSFEDQQQDTSYIGDLLPRKTDTDTGSSLKELQQPASKQELPLERIQTVILDGINVSKAHKLTSIAEIPKNLKTSASQLGGRKQSVKLMHSGSAKNMTSDSGQRSNKQLSHSAKKSRPGEIKVEDAELFAKHLEHAPQRLVQRRKTYLTQILSCTIGSLLKCETHTGKK